MRFKGFEFRASDYLESEGWDAEWGVSQVQKQGGDGDFDPVTGEVYGEGDAYATDPDLAAMADAEQEFGSKMPF